MSLGLLSIVKNVELGNAKLLKATIVGDNAYPAGGSTGLLAKVRAALSDDNAAILSVKDDSGPTASLSRLEYDHTNEKLFARVKTTGVESAVSDQSALTYTLTMVVY